VVFGGLTMMLGGLIVMMCCLSWCCGFLAFAHPGKPVDQRARANVWLYFSQVKRRPAQLQPRAD
jgi:hypothetical protein